MSILKKISFLFVISLILMTIIGSWIDTINSKRMDNLVKEKYLKVIEDIFRNIENKNYINSVFEKNQLELLKDFKDSNEEIIYEQNYTFGHIIILKRSFADEFIIKIKYLDEEYILKTPDEQNLNDKTILNLLVFLDIFALFLIFLYIIKLLTPLKTITKEITNFANGDLSTRININSKDEIGTLAKTFNSMASSLENSIKTREELLRDIGHELRTPIAKGKFAIEKIDDFSQKELLKKIFLDLEILTNELIELEKLNLTKLNISTFSAETLVLESLGKLYLEDESKIEIEINEDFKIDADLYYLSIALKNLIDNALKYAISFPIIIKVNKNEISISNKGKQLSKEFEYYLKPFTQELSQRDGFGLGLSIVKKILDRHNFQLLYSYENEFNIFKIVL
ncbi:MULTISPECIES: ArsS family sensor histidine kinase [Arcobacter]|uniref:histidine kinase n=1 Tax=Arcobacter defluvii TaxID=873191 RepID=A0AAE7E8E2_9BACT|nr:MULTISPECIES: ArsS family sensor histidine kinase [Arcobacter]QKF78956.1 two-component system sensor histidine kinase [Arcobacter defluvii]RXI32224.1 sensor histidine kinase [Arcobacter defluvii]BAK74711.1 two-component sensor kinase [Arcobacter sp. L]